MSKCDNDKCKLDLYEDIKLEIKCILMPKYKDCDYNDIRKRVLDKKVDEIIEIFKKHFPWIKK